MQFLEQQSYRTLYKKRAEPCIINGVFYTGISQASKKLKKSPATIKKRCLSNEYGNYFFISKNDVSNDYSTKK